MLTSDDVRMYRQRSRRRVMAEKKTDGKKKRKQMSRSIQRCIHLATFFSRWNSSTVSEDLCQENIDEL